jgi:hypothetical protein
VRAQSRNAEKYEASVIVKEAQTRLNALSKSDVDRFFRYTQKWNGLDDMLSKRRKLLKIICKTKFANADHFCDL